jgi:beta-lactamase class D
MIILLIFASPLLAKSTVEKDFSPIFGKFPGTIIIYNQNADTWTVYNQQRSNTRYTPFSTFKIPNSIIALETGVIKDTESVYKWDRSIYYDKSFWMPDWDKPHNLRSGIKYSVVPLYRDLAAHIGKDKMQKYVNRFDYGNNNISSGIDNFWLNGSLKITAKEQVDFLYRFYNNKLEISKKTTEAVKDILIQEKTEDYTLSAKTGAGTIQAEPLKTLGWYVGYLETKGNVYYFAMNIEGGSFDEILKPRAAITKAVLKELNIL